MSTTKATRQRVLRALAVGINNYPGTANDLSGCVNDAQDWASALNARGFTTTTLLDEKATKQAMLDGIAKLIDETRIGDVGVITYSGHGTWVPDQDGDEPDGRDEALCPHDLRTAGPLLDDELHELFAARRYGARLVMISDSCHSGSVTRFASLRGSEVNAARIRFMPPVNFLSNENVSRALKVEHMPARGLPRPFGGALLAGCMDTEYSYDAWFGERPNGAFSYVALRALESLPVGGTIRQWHTLIRQGLPSVEYPQTPQVGGTRTQLAWPALA